MTPEERIKELGLDISSPAAPVANYVPAVKTANLVFVSGQGPQKPDGTYMKGILGIDTDLEQGYEAARLCAIASLAALRFEIGNLNKVERIVKILGMVNATPEFEDHPKVINGFSDLMIDVFGDRGMHARSAVGMGGLPFGIPVEVEMVVAIK